MTEQKDGRVALITGANRGLGYEIARQLGNMGISVVVGGREIGRAEDAAAKLHAEGISAHSLALDVINMGDIHALPGFFTRKFHRLDILVNNAGVMIERERGMDVEVLRETYESNVFAPYAITQALLPLLKESPAGRVVNQSSILGSLEYNGDPKMIEDGFLLPAYNSSKTALNALTVIFSRQLADTKVKVNSAHPGWVKTDMGGAEAPLSVEEGARTAVQLATLPDDGPTGGFFHLGEALPW